jgi:hypothetical protein
MIAKAKSDPPSANNRNFLVSVDETTISYKYAKKFFPQQAYFQQKRKNHLTLLVRVHNSYQ